MDNFICNKCFATSDRGKIPFHVTQCGHIYCTACIQGAQKQCLQCEQQGILSIPLEAQYLPKVEHLFEPLGESLSSLGKVNAFQSSQTNIILKRFCDIDKKYEKIKPRYCAIARQLKMLTEKYRNLKMENEILRKENISLQMCNGKLGGVSSNKSLLMNRMLQGQSRNSSRSQFSFDRSGGTSTTTAAQTFNTNLMDTDRRMTSGFHMSNYKPTTSGSSRLASGPSSSIYNLRR